jgi:hypothetical protein
MLNSQYYKKAMKISAENKTTLKPIKALKRIPTHF